MIDQSKIYEYLTQKNSNSNLQLLEALPENKMKDSIKCLIITENQLSTLLGFGSLLPTYCHGNDCTIGEKLAYSLYSYGKELFISGKYPDLYLMTVLGYAQNYLTALINLSEFKQADTFIVSELPFWQEYIDNPDKLNANDRPSFIDNFKSIMVSWIDVLMNLNKIDDAWKLAFNKPDIEGNWSSDIELNRLRQKLNILKSDVVQLDKNENQRKEEAYEDQQSNTNIILDSLQKAMKQTGLDFGMVDKIRQSKNLDPFTRSGFSQLEDVLTKGESFLKDNGSEINEISVRQEIRRASGIFVNNQPSKIEIEKSLEILKNSLQSALKLNNATLINDAYYGLYLCYSRLNESSKAADQLILLRNNLETIRKGIKNPLERGGVFQTYPYLFYSSVEHLYKANRYDDMLDAIEGSKGRAITDSLERESSQNIEDFNQTNIRKRLQPILAKENAHYITFHIDDTCSYVSIVVKTGELFASQIPIGKPFFDKLYRKLLHDPRKWQLTRRINVIEELTPFIYMIQELSEQGLIKEGDHICYSSDYLLYLFPLHFLKIKDKFLIELFTVSRIHNAGHLIDIMSKPKGKIDSCETIEVPSTENIKDPDQMKDFHFLPSYLLNIYSNKCDSLKHTEATIVNVLSSFKHNQLVHFSTHGFFPYNDNPFNNSGLLLSDNNKLPTLKSIDPDYKYENDGLHLFSPKRLLGRESDLLYAHISLQACVSGHAREGISGDALGMEWAFFQKGVFSMVSTFWDVDTANANSFYKFFYDEWLIKKTSKAMAHQKAVLHLKESKHESYLPDEYFWAGYSLIGDWR